MHAGKTTTLRSVLGLTPARHGRVVFNEIDITRLPTHRIVKSGIAFVPEDRGIFPTVTVEEHLAIAYGASKHRPRRKPIEHVFEIFPRLAERRRHRPAGAKILFNRIDGFCRKPTALFG